MPRKISTCLTFQGKAEVALKFYTTVFADAKIQRTDRTPPSVAKQTGALEGSVLAQQMLLGDLEIMALNGSPFQPTPATSFFVSCPSIPEIEKMWKKLSDGGEIRIPLDKQPWGAEKYGWTKDKFGVEWQLINSPNGKMEYGNSLLFVDKQFGQGAEALAFYTSVFKDSKVLSEVKEPKTGTLMHAAITLNGTEFWIMDGPGSHAYTFSGATSYFVYCENQAQIDYYWDKLTSGGGKPNVCGWLTDKFGVTWQVVPTQLNEFWEDPKTADRVMAALMKMTKLDIAKLEQAARAN